MSDTGVNEKPDPNKSKVQIGDLKTVPLDEDKVEGQSEDHYAEIGSIRAEILGNRFPKGDSLVPGPSLKGGVARVPVDIVIGGEKRGSSVYASVEEVLSSPFVDYDHVSLNYDHVSVNYDHVNLNYMYDHVSVNYDHVNLKYDHVSVNYDHVSLKCEQFSIQYMYRFVHECIFVISVPKFIMHVGTITTFGLCN